MTIKQISKAGGYAIVVRSLDDVKNAIETISKE